MNNRFFYFACCLTLILFTGFSAFAGNEPATNVNSEVASTTIMASETAIAPQAATAALPRLIDFGSKQCQACKAMEPVLDACKARHAAEFVTEFVDVWIPANQTFARSHDISSIPTQVFFDKEGKEVFRNTGFISEEQILAKWQELGLLHPPASAPEKVD